MFLSSLLHSKDKPLRKRGVAVRFILLSALDRKMTHLNLAISIQFPENKELFKYDITLYKLTKKSIFQENESKKHYIEFTL